MSQVEKGRERIYLTQVVNPNAEEGRGRSGGEER